MNQVTRQLKRRTLALMLILGLICVAGCGEKQARRAAVAPSKGVVGTILRVQGKVTYSLAPGGDRTPLTPGMKLRAEWTVHTGPGGGITAQLSNGHRWTLAGDLSKRISKIHALTLAPVKEGAVAQLSDLGAGGGKDRSAAAGLHQERTAGSKAAPTRAPAPPSDAELDEVTPPAKQAAHKRERKLKRKPRRAPRRPRTKPGALAGLFSPRPRRIRGASLGARGPRRRSGSRSRSGGGTVSKSGGESTPAASPAPQPVSTGKKLPKILTRKQLSRVIMSSRSRLASCLKMHKVTTAVTVRFVIRGATGRVVAVRVVGRTSGDKVVRCLRGRARAIRFPQFSGADTPHTFRLKAP